MVCRVFDELEHRLDTRQNCVQSYGIIRVLARGQEQGLDRLDILTAEADVFVNVQLLGFCDVEYYSRDSCLHNISP